MRNVIVFLRRLLLTSMYPHTPVTRPAWSLPVCRLFTRPHALAQFFLEIQLRSDTLHSFQAELHELLQGQPDILALHYDIAID